MNSPWNVTINSKPPSPIPDQSHRGLLLIHEQIAAQAQYPLLLTLINIPDQGTTIIATTFEHHVKEVTRQSDGFFDTIQAWPKELKDRVPLATLFKLWVIYRLPQQGNTSAKIKADLQIDFLRFAPFYETKAKEKKFDDLIEWSSDNQLQLNLDSFVQDPQYQYTFLDQVITTPVRLNDAFLQLFTALTTDDQRTDNFVLEKLIYRLEFTSYPRSLNSTFQAFLCLNEDTMASYRRMYKLHGDRLDQQLPAAVESADPLFMNTSPTRIVVRGTEPSVRAVHRLVLAKGDPSDVLSVQGTTQYEADAVMDVSQIDNFPPQPIVRFLSQAFESIRLQDYQSSFHVVEMTLKTSLVVQEAIDLTIVRDLVTNNSMYNRYMSLSEPEVHFQTKRQRRSDYGVLVEIFDHTETDPALATRIGTAFLFTSTPSSVQVTIETTTSDYAQLIKMYCARLIKDAVPGAPLFEDIAKDYAPFGINLKAPQPPPSLSKPKALSKLPAFSGQDYPRECGKDRQPALVTDERYAQIADTRRKMLFQGLKLACETDHHPYIKLQERSKLPCCFKDPPKEEADANADEARSSSYTLQKGLSTFKPAEIADTAFKRTLRWMGGRGDYKRFGVGGDRQPQSFVDVLLVAHHWDWQATTKDKLEARLKQSRATFEVTQNDLGSILQENPTATTHQLMEAYTNPATQLDPSKWYRLLEQKLRCNIFIFSEKQSVISMTVPPTQHLLVRYQYNPELPTYLVLERLRDDGTLQSELVMDMDPKKRPHNPFQFFGDIPSHVDRLVQRIAQQYEYDQFAPVNNGPKKVRFLPSPSGLFPSRFNAQCVDTKGRARVLVSTTHRIACHVLLAPLPVRVISMKDALQQRQTAPTWAELSEAVGNQVKPVTISQVYQGVNEQRVFELTFEHQKVQMTTVLQATNDVWSSLRQSFKMVPRRIPQLDSADELTTFARHAKRARILGDQMWYLFAQWFHQQQGAASNLTISQLQGVFTRWSQQQPPMRSVPALPETAAIQSPTRLALPDEINSNERASLLRKLQYHLWQGLVTTQDQVLRSNELTEYPHFFETPVDFHAPDNAEQTVLLTSLALLGTDQVNVQASLKTKADSVRNMTDEQQAAANRGLLKGYFYQKKDIAGGHLCRVRLLDKAPSGPVRYVLDGTRAPTVEDREPDQPSERGSVFYLKIVIPEHPSTNDPSYRVPTTTSYYSVQVL